MPVHRSRAAAKTSKRGQLSRNGRTEPHYPGSEARSSTRSIPRPLVSHVPLPHHFQDPLQQLFLYTPAVWKYFPEYKPEGWIDRPSHSAKRDPDHRPRPSNDFFIYKSYLSYVTALDGQQQQDVCKATAGKWKDFDERTKKPFSQMALILQNKHRVLYPDYKYTPTKGPSKTVASVKREAVDRLSSSSKDSHLASSKTAPVAYTIPLTPLPTPAEILSSSISAVTLFSGVKTEAIASSVSLSQGESLSSLLPLSPLASPLSIGDMLDDTFSSPRSISPIPLPALTDALAQSLSKMTLELALSYGPGVGLTSSLSLLPRLELNQRQNIGSPKPVPSARTEEDDVYDLLINHECVDDPSDLPTGASLMPPSIGDESMALSAHMASAPIPFDSVDSDSGSSPSSPSWRLDDLQPEFELNETLRMLQELSTTSN